MKELPGVLSGVGGQEGDVSGMVQIRFFREAVSLEEVVLQVGGRRTWGSWVSAVGFEK